MISIAPPDGAALDEALRPIRSTVIDVTRTRRRVRRAGAATAGAVLVLSAVLVAANVLGVSVPGTAGHGASAEAAGVLHHAAVTAIGESDPVVKPGQFVKVVTVETSVGQYGVTDDGPAKYGVQIMETRTLYIPADPASDWVLVRKTGAPTTFLPAAHAAAAKAEYDKNGTPYPEGTWHARDGEFYGTPWSVQGLDAMPTEPHALLAYFDSHYTGGSASREEDTMVRATEVLTSGTATAKLRSAIYGMLALLPGVEVTDDAATVDGRTGIAIGRSEPNRGGEHQEIIIDPATGQLIGSRVIEAQAYGPLPAGTVWDSTAVTTSVADTAP